MFELILASFGLVAVIFVSVTLYRMAFFVSFLLSSILSSMTIIGSLNINVLLISISTLLLLLFRSWNFNFSRTLFLAIISVILLCVSILSFFSGVELPSALGKWLKTFIVFLPLTIIKSSSTSLLPNQCTAVYIPFTKAFLLFSYLLVIPYSIFVDVDYGVMNLPRFSGFFYDSNYMAAICFCLLYLLISAKRVNQNTKNKYLIRVLIFTIILTQSFTFITFTCGLMFFKQVKHDYGWGTGRGQFALPFLVGLAYIVFIFYLHSFFEIKIADNYETSVTSLKLNSLLFRLMPQFSVIELMIKQPSLFLTGYGSGHVAELFGRVLHNFYLQLLFDNGAIFWVVVLLAIGYFFAVAKCNVYLTFTILITNYLFDNVYMFVFTFFIFLCLLWNNVNASR